MKKQFKIILLVALAVVMTLTFAACSSEEPVAEAEPLLVGMECGYPPFNWTQNDDSNGAVAIQGGGFAGGYDVEIAKRIAESMGRELVIVKTIWDGLVPAVQSDTIDLIIAGMSPTEDRKVSIDFSDNYYKSDLVIVVRADSPYAAATTLGDFAGAKITAQLSTFHYTVISQIEGVDEQVAMDDFPAMRVALESGVIDGYVSERPEAISAVAAKSAFAFVGFEEGQGFVTSDDDTAIAVGLKKNNTELMEAVNAALATISEEDRIAIMDQAIVNQPSEQ